MQNNGSKGYGSTKAATPAVTERFKPVVPDAAKVEVHDAIASASTEFTRLAKQIEENLPEGRERALALTKLEESYLFVAAAIGRAELENAWS